MYIYLSIYLCTCVSHHEACGGCSCRYFYASLYLGSPPKKFAVIVDTGSTMTYVPCSHCGSACGPNHQDAAFDPSASSTARMISCDSNKCRCGSPQCTCSDTQQCVYTRSYAEQSSSSGVLVEDILSLHDGRPGAPVIFGCETMETGEIFKQRADGLFGLGNSDSSVMNQLVSAGEIDDVFSLCFGLVEGDGVLMLGDSPATQEVDLQHTPIIPSAMHPFYYNVQLDAISVAGTPLNVPTGIFQEGYAVVLDSGTTFTYVPSPVFRAFAEAVEKHALARGLFRVRGPDPQYDDICFGGGPEHTNEEALLSVFPSFALHFASDVTLMLGPLNYLFVHTFNSGKYCLGLFDNGKSGTLLGGITFRNILVQYDRKNRRIGFGSAQCKELGRKYRPPCSVFGVDGNDLTVVVATADGDCTPDVVESDYAIRSDVASEVGLGSNGSDRAFSYNTQQALDQHHHDRDYEDQVHEEMVMPIESDGGLAEGEDIVHLGGVVEEDEDVAGAENHESMGDEQKAFDDQTGSDDETTHITDRKDTPGYEGQKEALAERNGASGWRWNHEFGANQDADNDGDGGSEEWGTGSNERDKIDLAGDIHRVFDDRTIQSDISRDEDVWASAADDDGGSANRGDSPLLRFPRSTVSIVFLSVLVAMICTAACATIYLRSGREFYGRVLQRSFRRYQPLRPQDGDPEEGCPDKKFSDDLGELKEAEISAIVQMAQQSTGHNGKGKVPSSAGGVSGEPLHTAHSQKKTASIPRNSVDGVNRKGSDHQAGATEMLVVSLVDSRSLMSSGPSGELRKGLTTPQKLQRTNSNSAATAVASFAEEAGLGSSVGHHTPKSGGRPSTPTRM